MSEQEPMSSEIIECARGCRTQQEALEVAWRALVEYGPTVALEALNVALMFTGPVSMSIGLALYLVQMAFHARDDRLRRFEQCTLERTVAPPASVRDLQPWLGGCRFTYGDWVDTATGDVGSRRLQIGLDPRSRRNLWCCDVALGHYVGTQAFPADLQDYLWEIAYRCSARVVTTVEQAEAIHARHLQALQEASAREAREPCDLSAWMITAA